MNIVDAHQHFWDLQALDYPWLKDADQTSFFGSIEPLVADYLPENYRADTAGWSVLKTVHVQAECDPGQAVAETRWLSGLDADLPSAIVAYADLAADDAGQVLEQHCAYSRVRGIRQILNFHENPDLTYTTHNLLNDERWLGGFQLLRQFNLSFDMQLYPRQMPQAAQLAGIHDDVQFILNHTGMPVDRDGPGLAAWRTGMAALAERANVAVKISGLGMTDPQWTTERIRPFVLETIERFGVERCLFASNFPVDRLFSDFGALFTAFSDITAQFSTAERQRLFYDNAERLYRL